MDDMTFIYALAIVLSLGMGINFVLILNELEKIKNKIDEFKKEVRKNA